MTKTGKDSKIIWQSISLLGMLLAPVLLLYPSTKSGNTFLEIAGYAVMIFAMVIPLGLKK